MGSSLWPLLPMLKVILGIMAMDMALVMDIHIMDMPLLDHAKTTLELQFPCALGRKKREAEAEPWWGYGYGYGLAHPYTLGYGCHNTYGAPVPCAGRKKREAEAKPWLGYGYPYAYGYAAPVVGAAVAVKPCTNVNGEKVDCALGHKDIATAHIV